MEKKLGDVANRLLFENDRVKVWQMDLAPGESSDFHEHTLPYVLCIAEGETVDADFENGKSIRIPVQPGTVYFVEPGSRETAVNRSEVRFREFLIELKAQAASEARSEPKANGVRGAPGPARS